jgi:putative tryptophan/tyrosine transport system substrate-binding protein
MKRREFITLIGSSAAAWPFAAQAQHRRKRVGILWHAGSAQEEMPYFDALHGTLRGLGYIEGDTITLEDRFPNEKPELFVDLAAELTALPVDVLVTVTLPAVLAAQAATKTIPIIFILVPDPVGSKLVNSFARPGGNITGLTQIAVELSAKRLELLKEAFPRIARVALVINANSQQTMDRVVEENRTAAGALGLEIQPVEVRSLQDFEQAFDKIVDSRLEGIVVYPDGLTYQGRALLAQYARERRLPLVVFSRESLAAGALMSYGPNYEDIFRRAAFYIDKILKGEKPADLPVELPTKFELFVNLKTAKSLGIELPPTLLTRADEVIE